MTRQYQAECTQKGYEFSCIISAKTQKEAIELINNKYIGVCIDSISSVGK